MKKKEVELSELRKIFEGSNDSKSKLGLSLLEKAEFMNTTLDQLRKKVEENGVVTQMCQGSYSIDRENPALRSYNTTIKNYTSIIKQLCELLPEQSKDVGENLLKFVANS